MLPLGSLFSEKIKYDSYVNPNHNEILYINMFIADLFIVIKSWKCYECHIIGNA